MKFLLVLTLLVFCSACSSVNNVAKKSDPASQEKSTQTSSNNNQADAEPTLPTGERAFVDAITEFDRKSIITLLGEPAKADDVKLKGSNKIVASIWHYHYINTNEDGVYYETTELDFIDDKVVQVVFLNNDGSEEAKSEGLAYEIPENKPSN